MKLKTRLDRDRDKLFTFLSYDGIPWNNNNAEHAIEAFARLRMVIRADRDGTPDRVSTRWSALNGETLISVTANDHHQQLIDAQLAKAGIVCRRGPTVNLLDTQIGLVEAEQGVAVIPSFALPVCRNRKVTMSELVEPLVTLEFYEISSSARQLPPRSVGIQRFPEKIYRTLGRSG